jgi:hypothetical protein
MKKEWIKLAALGSFIVLLAIVSMGAICSLPIE